MYHKTRPFRRRAPRLTSFAPNHSGHSFEHRSNEYSLQTIAVMAIIGIIIIAACCWPAIAKALQSAQTGQ